MAVAELLHAARSVWNGTLICLFQCDEESAGGAKVMVADCLYDKGEYGIPAPKSCYLSISRDEGWSRCDQWGLILTAVDSRDSHFRKERPHIAPGFNIVTKEVRPEGFAFIACASIHGGSTANIVPDFVDLKLSIRSYRLELHERLLAAVKRVVYAECEASGSLHIHEPTFTTIMQAPATINGTEHAEILKRAFKSYFGG